MALFEEIKKRLKLLRYDSIADSRRSELQPLIDYIQKNKDHSTPIRLNFICTHNSRRSQLSQVWAQLSANQFGLPLECYSGGTEITSCNIRTIESLKRFGFEVKNEEGQSNPKYQIHYEAECDPIILFSKLYNDPVNPKEGYAAIMTCSNADENCPVILGCEERISLTYEDPKDYDGSTVESAMYDLRSMEIASEMMYCFSKIH